MNCVSYFSPVLEPEKTGGDFAALTTGFEVGGPSLAIVTGHQWNLSSTPSKGKARRLR
jgi:hypothetical protein